jgi:hypothetical protein
METSQKYPFKCDQVQVQNSTCTQQSEAHFHTKWVCENQGEAPQHSQGEFPL